MCIVSEQVLFVGGIFEDSLGLVKNMGPCLVCMGCSGGVLAHRAWELGVGVAVMLLMKIGVGCGGFGACYSMPQA